MTKMKFACRREKRVPDLLRSQFQNVGIRRIESYNVGYHVREIVIYTRDFHVHRFQWRAFS